MAKTLKQVIEKETRHLLRSKEARKYKYHGHVYELELELVDGENGKQYLEVQTWGHDYARIEVPSEESYPNLVRLKVHEQLLATDGHNDGPNQVALRYYLNIMSNYAEESMK